MNKIAKFLIQFLAATVAVTGVLVAFTGVIGWTIAGGYVVAGWVGPVEWPESLTGNAPYQALAVLAYISLVIGICIGFWAACKEV